MSRKRCKRRVIVPMPPRGLRPRLAADQVRDLGLAHWSNIDALASGQANEETLLQWIGGALTWHYAAEKLHAKQPDVYAEPMVSMKRQAEVADSVVERWKRTGRIGFSGQEYQDAKDAAGWMDALAEVVDRATAIEAANWSEEGINAIAAKLPAAPARNTEPMACATK